MMKIEISGMPTLCIEHLVLDYNGTVAINDALDALLHEPFDRNP